MLSAIRPRHDRVHNVTFGHDFGGGIAVLDFLRTLLKAEEKRARVDVTCTEEELEASRRHGELLNLFAPEPGQVLHVAVELANPLKALALVEHVAKQMALEVPEEEFGPLMNKVIATQAKA